MFVKRHHFRGCQNLQRTIQTLYDTNQIIPSVYSNYCKYHFSVLKKLRAIEISLEELKDTIAKIDTSQDIKKEDLKELLFQVNYRLDSFLYFCVSSLDVFARDILSYYDLIPSGRNAKVYFHTARHQIRNINQNNTLLSRLQDPPWLQELLDYRNCATHESTLTEAVNTETIEIGPELRTTIGLKLPDDPKVHPRSYNRSDTVITDYCDLTFNRILRLFNPIYIDLNSLIIANSGLPLIP